MPFRGTRDAGGGRDGQARRWRGSGPSIVGGGSGVSRRRYVMTGDRRSLVRRGCAAGCGVVLLVLVATGSYGTAAPAQEAGPAAGAAPAATTAPAEALSAASGDWPAFHGGGA